LMDQEYSGDINIVPSFNWYNPAKILSHLSEKDLMDLMVGGEHSAFPNLEAIRICTKISRTMEEILHRFESGDLRPDESEYHRPRASRRRPRPTRADREAMREHQVHSDKVQKPAKKTKPAKRKKSAPRRKASTTAKTPTEGDSGPLKVA
jgi:TAG lipase/steryl ester hydrolase/phospholipase A2/LPA acyltransferase